MLSGYEENSSNVTYLYADRDKKTIYTNRKEYADFDNLDDSVKKIGMLDKYVLVGARASQFEGNVTGVLYSDRSSGFCICNGGGYEVSGTGCILL